MTTKTKAFRNTDAKQVSALQKYELKHICDSFIYREDSRPLVLMVLKRVMRNLGDGKNKLCHSRRKIYIGLQAFGFIRKPKK